MLDLDMTRQRQLQREKAQHVPSERESHPLWIVLAAQCFRMGVELFLVLKMKQGCDGPGEPAPYRKYKGPNPCDISGPGKNSDAYAWKITSQNQAVRIHFRLPLDGL